MLIRCGAIVAVLALFAAACGNDDGGDESGAEATATPTEAVEDADDATPDLDAESTSDGSVEVDTESTPEGSVEVDTESTPEGSVEVDTESTPEGGPTGVDVDAVPDNSVVEVDTDATPEGSVEVDTDTIPDNVERVGPGAVDPCSLWTAADLSGVTGLSFDEGAFNAGLSVNGQLICDWIVDSPLANAQVLLVNPELDYATLREGTNTSAGPVTDFDVPGARAAHISADGFIVGVDTGAVVMQLSFLPPAGSADTSGQLRALAEIAVANL